MAILRSPTIRWFPKDSRSGYWQTCLKPSWKKVMQGIKLLKKHGVEWNAMAVVNAYNVPKNTAMKAHLSWLASDWVTEQQKPIGIGGDPKGATKEKGEIILSISAKEIVKDLILIRDFKE